MGHRGTLRARETRRDDDDGDLFTALGRTKDYILVLRDGLSVQDRLLAVQFAHFLHAPVPFSLAPVLFSLLLFLFRPLH